MKTNKMENKQKEVIKPNTTFRNKDKVKFISKLRNTFIVGISLLLLTGCGGKTSDQLEFLKYNVIMDDLICVSNENGKYGYKNVNDKLVIDYKYDDAFSFGRQGYASVSKDGKYGLIDEKDKKIIDFKYQYLDSSPTIITNSDYIVAQKNNKVGIIDSKENVIIDFKYDAVHAEDGSTTAISYISPLGFILMKNGKTGIVDFDGKVLVDFKYRYITVDDKTGNYAAMNDDKVIYFKSNGEKITTIKADTGYGYQECGYATYDNYYDNGDTGTTKSYVIDEKGKTLGMGNVVKANNDKYYIILHNDNNLSTLYDSDMNVILKDKNNISVYKDGFVCTSGMDEEGNPSEPEKTIVYDYDGKKKKTINKICQFTSKYYLTIGNGNKTVYDFNDNVIYESSKDSSVYINEYDDYCVVYEDSDNFGGANKMIILDGKKAKPIIVSYQSESEYDYDE